MTYEDIQKFLMLSRLTKASRDKEGPATAIFFGDPLSDGEIAACKRMFGPDVIIELNGEVQQ